VRVARHISTRYAHRAGSLAPIVKLMAAQFKSSLATTRLLQQLRLPARGADLFEAQCPQVPSWRQSSRMSEAEQAQFLARFTPDGQGIGFAVLGGSFAEGIDLPGGRLIGAFIATLGCRRSTRVNEQMKQRLRALRRGLRLHLPVSRLQKVVQAAGRVIRTPSDRGVVHLMDDRFARAEVQRLLPSWWRLSS